MDNGISKNNWNTFELEIKYAMELKMKGRIILCNLNKKKNK